MRKIIYKSGTTISTWTYDYSVMTNGPVSVEVEYLDLPPEKTKKKNKKKNESA